MNFYPSGTPIRKVEAELLPLGIASGDIFGSVIRRLNEAIQRIWAVSFVDDEFICYGNCDQQAWVLMAGNHLAVYCLPGRGETFFIHVSRILSDNTITPLAYMEIRTSLARAQEVVAVTQFLLTNGNGHPSFPAWNSINS